MPDQQPAAGADCLSHPKCSPARLRFPLVSRQVPFRQAGLTPVLHAGLTCKKGAKQSNFDRCLTVRASVKPPHLAIRVQESHGRQTLIEVCGILDNGAHNAIRWVPKLREV